MVGGYMSDFEELNKAAYETCAMEATYDCEDMV